MKNLIFLLVALSSHLYVLASNQITHHLWVDYSQNKAVYNGNNLKTEIDLSTLADGFHVLNHIAVLPDGSPTPPQRALFVKSATIADGRNLDCYAIVDNNMSKRYDCIPIDGIIHVDFDMSELSDGLHRLTVYLVPKGSSAIVSPVSSYFIKLPTGGTKITRYCYWFNDEKENAVTVDCNNPSTPMEIMGLVNVGEMSFNTSSFDFATDADDIVLTAKHNYNLWAMDNSGRFSQTMTRSFADQRTQRRIAGKDIAPLANCHEKSVGIIQDEEMKWYKFDGEIGDSLAMILNRKAMYELFSPSGEKILARKGGFSQIIATATLMESGTYYLGIHDVAPVDRSSLKLSFNHIPRNAILSVSPTVIPSGSSSIMLDIFGNGMRDTQTVMLRDADGAIYESKGFSFIDNYRLNGYIGLEDSIPIGTYDVLMHVINKATGEEKDIVKNRALNVINKDGTPDIRVNVVPSRKPATPYMVDINVTNNSDIPYWGIPFNVACERNRGRNGYIFYMKDFLGETMSMDHIPWYETENLLGTGTDGVFFPLILTCLQPHETRTLKVGIMGEAHDRIGLYVWTGTPYSVESKTLKSIPADSLNSMSITFSNIFDLKTAAYMLSAIEESTSDVKLQSRHRAPEDEDVRVLEFMREYGPTIIGTYEPLDGPAGYADNVARISNGVGEAVAGVTNAGAGYHSFVKLEELHIPGATLGEKLRNVEIMYGGFDNIGPEAADVKYYYLQGKKELARAKSPEDIFADATDTSDWLHFWRAFTRRNAESPTPMPTRNEIEILMSGDPNMITGYSDPCGGNFVGKNVNRLEYTIEFENDPAIASAAASYVRVDNQLDAEIFNFSSFEPVSIEIGNRLISIPASQSYVTTVDMRPEIRCLVEIRQEYSAETGKLCWLFNALDPITMEPVVDYLQGFLPVNDDTGRGTGRITYVVDLKDGLAHDTTFSNSASIVFDDNAPVVTPVWENITDYELPYAYIAKQYGYDGECYAFDVVSSDIGSGIYSYDLYIRLSGSREWITVMTQQTEGQIEFYTPEELPGAEFKVMATDRAGNRQSASFADAPSDIVEIAVPETSRHKFHDLLGRPVGKPSVPGIYVDKGRKIIVK